MFIGFCRRAVIYKLPTRAETDVVVRAVQKPDSRLASSSRVASAVPSTVTSKSECTRSGLVKCIASALLGVGFKFLDAV